MWNVPPRTPGELSADERPDPGVCDSRSRSWDSSQRINRAVQANEWRNKILKIFGTFRSAQSFII
jgi:hypothetical protein